MDGRYWNAWRTCSQEASDQAWSNWIGARRENHKKDDREARREARIIGSIGWLLGTVMKRKNAISGFYESSHVRNFIAAARQSTIRTSCEEAIIHRALDNIITTVLLYIYIYFIIFYCRIIWFLVYKLAKDGTGVQQASLFRIKNYIMTTLLFRSRKLPVIGDGS